MPDTPTLADVIGAALCGHDPDTPEAFAAIERAVERAFVLIPRNQTEQVQHDYQAPVDLAKDDPAIETYHVHMAVAAIAESVRDGLLVISRPEFTELPRQPYHPRTIVSYRLTATGWRLPDADPPDPDQETP